VRFIDIDGKILNLAQMVEVSPSTTRPPWFEVHMSTGKTHLVSQSERDAIAAYLRNAHGLVRPGGSNGR
jgi:hypothetical protein